jgi:DNA polymerase-1
MLGKVRAALKPTHLIVVWDGGLAAERMDAHPEYKLHRPPMPEALEQQVQDIVQYLNAAGITSLCREGVEADDWIAALTRCALEALMPVIIASSDKDFMQLVCNRVALLNPNDKTERIWTVDEVRMKTGVYPEQIVDWLSLIGDSVDNIPGVPGVGAKTAAELLQQFGSVDGLYGRLNEVKSDRLRLALQSAEATVHRNQRLIRLHQELPCEFDLENARPRDPDGDKLAALFAHWGFKTMLAQVAASRQTQKELL